MENYIKGLIQDIEHKILLRWNENTPQHYREGQEYTDEESPPKYWIKQKPLSPEIRIQLHFKELDAWETGEGEMPMYQIFNLLPEAFPPAEKLSKNQLNKLLFAIYRLWISYNFYPEPPEGFPKNKLYTLMCSYMHEVNQLQNQSATVVDFCGCYPPECPFGNHCQCRLEDEMEDELDHFLSMLDQKHTTN